MYWWYSKNSDSSVLCEYKWENHSALDEQILLTHSLDIIWRDIIFKSNRILTRMMTCWRVTSKGQCRSWRRSIETAPSSSGWGRPDSRARGGSPSAQGASPWSCLWAAPGRRASRSRGGTGPGKSGGESQLWKPETGDYEHVLRNVREHSENEWKEMCELFSYVQKNIKSMHG